MSVAASLSPQQRLDVLAFAQGAAAADGAPSPTDARCYAWWAGYFYAADALRDCLEAGEVPELVGFEGLSWAKADAQLLAKRNELDGMPARDAVVELIRARILTHEEQQ